MASAAANSALGTEVLAVQRLFYDITPNAATSIFMLFSSQMIGYGLGGLMRRKWNRLFDYGYYVLTRSRFDSHLVVPN